MMFLWVGLGLVAAAIVFVIAPAFVFYRVTFYEPGRKITNPDEIETPEGAIYDPYREKMKQWVLQTRAMPSTEYSVTSFDGLKLYGRYFAFSPDAPVELMFHGYRGGAERDMSGGVQRAFKVGHSALIVEQRCSRKSEGNVISFGINERRDCLAWVDLLIRELGPDVKIILTGISMGASTVLMAAGEPLPENVIGVLADCGFDSPKEIIKQVIRQLHLPANLLYPFVKLGARLFGNFNLEETTPLEAMRKCKVPVIFYHGEDDDFVPVQMSINNYEACTTRKKLVVIPGAGHGLCYAVDPELYIKTLQEFYP